MFHREKTFLLPLLLLATGPSYGELSWEPEPPPLFSTLSLDYLADNREGWNRQFGLSLAGPMRLRFDLVYGESRIDSELAAINADYRSLGIASDPLKPVSMDLTYETWGRKGSLTIDTWRLGLSYNALDFSLSLIPQQRIIRLYVMEDSPRIRSPYVEVDGKDIGLRFAWFGVSDWALSAEYFHFDYSRKPTKLANDYRLLLVFPLETFELAGGLDARQTRFAVTRFISLGEIGGEWLRATSAVDGGRADIGTLYTAIELDPAWTLRLQGGVQQVDGEEDAIYFLGMGLDYLW